MSLKKCICINHKNDDLEYQPLQEILSPYSKIVHKSKKVKYRPEGRYSMEEKVIDESFILVSHPNNSTASYKVLVKDKAKFNLVINHTQHSCYPVNKKFFVGGAYIDKKPDKAPDKKPDKKPGKHH